MSEMDIQQALARAMFEGPLTWVVTCSPENESRTKVRCAADPRVQVEVVPDMPDDQIGFTRSDGHSFTMTFNE